MNKQFKRFLFLFLVLVSLLIFPFPLGRGTVTVDVASVYPPDNAATLDTTPDFRCTPISNVSEYVNVTLYVDGVASGTVTNHPNGTEVTITCNWTLPISDEKIPWYFSITDADDTYQTETRYISIGAYFKAPAVLLNPNATTEHWTYYLNASVLDYSSSPAVSIPDDNITLNGQGYTLDGDDVAGYGIYIYRTSSTTTNITICNVTLTDWHLGGIYLWYANLNTIANVTANSSENGIRLEYSNANNLINVTASSNNNGLLLYYSDDNNLVNVTASDNNNGLYFDNSNGNNLTIVAANHNTNIGLRLEYSDGCTLANVTANNNIFGLYLDHSDGDSVRDCVFQNNTEWDIYVYTTADFSLELTNVIGTDDKPIVCYNSTVILTDWSNNASEIILLNADSSILNQIVLNRTGDTKNNGILAVCVDYANFTNIQVYNAYVGLDLEYSSRNNLINVTANNNGLGLFFNHGSRNNLVNVKASNNYRGLRLFFSDYNTVHDCVFQNNTGYGVCLYSAGKIPNIFYNNLFNNTLNVLFEGTVYVNYWNTIKQEGTRIYSAGPYIGGNYWTNPTGTGPSDIGIDADCDGFLDSPLEIGTNNTDYLPYSNKYMLGWHGREKEKEEITPTPPEVEAKFCLPLTFFLLLGAMFVLGLYLYSQRETWKISIPLIPIVLWLIIFEPKTPIDQMPITVLRYFVVPPWHIIMAIILIIVACAALLSKEAKK